MKKTKIKKDLSNKIKKIGSGSKIRGITLISLVITIIVLLILAGITIAQLSNSVLFSKSQEAKEKHESTQELENITIADYENKIDNYVSGNREKITLTEEEYEIFKNQYYFSNEEKIIGKWTNGKNIYRKVLSGTNSNNSSEIFVAEGVTSGNNIINYYGEIKAKDGNWININYEGTCMLYWNTPTSKLKWYIKDNNFNGGEYHIVIEYTKSTD